MQTERQNTFTLTFVEIEMSCNIQLWLLPYYAHDYTDAGPNKAVL